MIGRRPDGWSSIRNFFIRCTRVRTMLTDVRTVVFELWFLPYVWVRPDGNPRRPDGWINLPLIELGKKIGSWSITGRRSDWCKLAQKLLDTVKGLDENPRRPDGWCLVCLVSGWYGTSSGRMEQWTNERPDGMARSSGWLTGNHKSSDLQAESSETLLNSGIPVKTSSLKTSDFVQTECS